MNHSTRTIVLALTLAVIGGYFLRVLAEIDLFLPVTGMIGCAFILILARWLIGRRD